MLFIHGMILGFVGGLSLLASGLALIFSVWNRVTEQDWATAPEVTELSAVPGTGSVEK